VLDGVSLTIPAGRTSAIVGPSGGGKTTIADLIIGLLTPDEGRVVVDGVPLGPERMRSWRAQIGYVVQDSFLFHDSIRANMLWADPDATDAEIWTALEQAAAADFVSALPDGLDAIVGDRGARLSGGERQRLTLARALLRKPALLVLDEATSAIDSENERKIQAAVEALHGVTTILVITHRLATIQGADNVFVIEGGRVVETGPWSALVGDVRGRLRALREAQSI
jgi:ATP-binding cassette subfamily C protein